VICPSLRARESGAGTQVRLPDSQNSDKELLSIMAGLFLKFLCLPRAALKCPQASCSLCACCAIHTVCQACGVHFLTQCHGRQGLSLHQKTENAALPHQCTSKCLQVLQVPILLFLISLLPCSFCEVTPHIQLMTFLYCSVSLWK
jgi:hypothetical protein